MKDAKQWLDQLLERLFQPVSRGQALEIAAQALARPPKVDGLVCHSEKPATCRMYDNPPEPCWYVYAPWDDDKQGIRSSRVILVGKRTGLIHYDGEAGDEG